MAEVADIDKEIATLLGLKRPMLEVNHLKPFGHPSLDTVAHNMVLVMKGKESMGWEEIKSAVKEHTGTEVETNTLRSYLTNYKCFHRVAKNKWIYEKTTKGSC